MESKVKIVLLVLAASALLGLTLGEIITYWLGI